MFSHILSSEGRIDIYDLGDDDIMPPEGMPVDIDAKWACADEGCVDGRMSSHGCFVTVCFRGVKVSFSLFFFCFWQKLGIGPNGGRVEGRKGLKRSKRLKRPVGIMST